MSLACTDFLCQTVFWPIDRTLSGANTPSKSGPASDSNKGIFHILQTPGFLEAYYQIV